MSSGFSVDPAVVKTTGSDIDLISESVGYAFNCVSFYVDAPTGEGSILREIGDGLTDARGVLMDEYAYDGRIRRNLDDAADALVAMGRDYEMTDQDVAAQFDGDLSGSSAEPLQYAGGQAGIDLGWCQGELSGIENTLDGKDLGQVTSTVEYIGSLGWLTEPLSLMNIANPFEGTRDKLDGDWRQLGTVVGACEGLVSYWTQVEAEIRLLPLRFTGDFVDPPIGYQRNADYNGAPNWSGNAADATQSWLLDVADKVADHRSALELKTTAIKSQLIAVYDAANAVLDIAEEVAGLVPYGDSIDDFILDVFKKAGPAVLKIASVVEKAVKVVRALIDGAFFLVGGVGELIGALHSLEFPSVAYSAPDVNGSAP